MGSWYVDPTEQNSELLTERELFGVVCACNIGLTNTDVYALAIDPTTPTTLYAGTFNGVFAIQQTQIPAHLTINYSSGAPGSYFTITGSNFPPDNTVTITINGNLLGTVPTDPSGSFIFILETNPTTDEGFYSVTVSVNPSATTQFACKKQVVCF